MKAGESGASSGEAVGAKADASSRGPSPSPAPSGSGRSITELELAFAEAPSSDAYIELCHAYLEKHRFMEAMVVCKKAARSHPEAVAPRLLLARVHEAQGRVQKARDVYEGLASEHEDEPAVLTAYGRFRLGAGEEDEGVALLKRALDLDPGQQEASELLEARGIVYPAPPPAPPPAEAPVERSLADAAGVAPAGPPTADLALPPGGVPLAGPPPGLTSAPDASGVYRMAPQRLEGEEELERLAEEVAQEAPPRGRPRTTLILIATLLVVSVAVVAVGLAHKARQEAINRLSKEAVAAFQRDLYAAYKRSADALEEILEEQDADHPKTLARLAHVYAILVHEHLEESVRPRLEAVLEKAEAVAGEDPHTIAARGLLRLHTGEDRSEAAAAAIDLLRPEAANGEDAVPSFVDLALGIAELERGDVERAQRRLRRAADFLGNNVRARIWAARAAASAGRLSTAKRSFLRAQKTEPRHPGALAGLALVTLAAGDLEGARSALDLFDALDSGGSRDISPKDRALAVFAKSELLRRDGREGPADVEYERAVKLDPENADFPFQRGSGLLRSDRLAEAITYLTKAVEMEPSRWTFRLQLAEALMLAKRFDEAKSHLDFALEKAGDELEVALAKARYLRRTNAPSAETYLIETLPERFPGAKVQIGLELGRYHRAQDELDKANAHLEEAIAALDGHSQALESDVLVSYGLVAWDMGREAAAVRAYERAAKRGNLDALALLAGALWRGSAEEREKALEYARQYLAAGEGLRRTDFVKKIVEQLESR